jgi:hypothetical protein
MTLAMIESTGLCCLVEQTGASSKGCGLRVISKSSASYEGQGHSVQEDRGEPGGWMQISDQDERNVYEWDRRVG